MCLYIYIWICLKIVEGSPISMDSKHSFPIKIAITGVYPIFRHPNIIFLLTSHYSPMKSRFVDDHCVSRTIHLLTTSCTMDYKTSSPHLSNAINWRGIRNFQTHPSSNKFQMGCDTKLRTALVQPPPTDPPKTVSGTPSIHRLGTMETTKKGDVTGEKDGKRGCWLFTKIRTVEF